MSQFKVYSFSEFVLNESNSGFLEPTDENLKKWQLDPAKVTKNEDGTISYNGDVSIEFVEGMSVLPFKFQEISGSLNITYGTLSSWVGIPTKIGKDFIMQMKVKEWKNTSVIEVGGVFRIHGRRIGIDDITIEEIKNVIKCTTIMIDTDTYFSPEFQKKYLEKVIAGDKDGGWTPGLLNTKQIKWGVDKKGNPYFVCMLSNRNAIGPSRDEAERAVIQFNQGTRSGHSTPDPNWYKSTKVIVKPGKNSEGQNIQVIGGDQSRLIFDLNKAIQKKDSKSEYLVVKDIHFGGDYAVIPKTDGEGYGFYTPVK